MSNLNYLEEELEKSYRKFIEALKEKNKSIKLLDASVLNDIMIKFIDDNGKKQSGKLYKFATVLTEKKSAKIVVNNPEDTKKIYKELGQKDYLKGISLASKNEINVEIGSGTSEDLKKNENLIRENLDNFKKAIESHKKLFRNKIKKEFAKDSKDTQKALENMIEDLTKKYLKIAKDECENAKKQLVRL